MPGNMHAGNICRYFIITYPCPVVISNSGNHSSKAHTDAQPWTYYSCLNPGSITADDS